MKKINKKKQTMSTYSVLSGNRKSGIAILAAHGKASNIDSLLEFFNVSPNKVSNIPLIKNNNFKEALITRPNTNTLWIMPPGGLLAIKESSKILEKNGFKFVSPINMPWESKWPEALSGGIAAALEALSNCRNELAFKVISKCLNAWEKNPYEPMSIQEKKHSIYLNRLIKPPLIALIGPPNIGKTALTNYLAKKNIARVADEKGTTRDAVEVELELDGLIVRWLDTPGKYNPTEKIDQEAISISNNLIKKADLVIQAIDSSSTSKNYDYKEIRSADLLIATRSDLGKTPIQLSTSSKNGEGIKELAIKIRKILFPDYLIKNQFRWPEPL